MPIFFVVWAVVTFSPNHPFTARSSLGSSRSPKSLIFASDREADHGALGEYVFGDMGMDRLLFFQENSEKLILGIFNSPISVFLAL